MSSEMSEYNTLAYIGAICFALCALPQVVACVKQGHAKGLDPIFLGLWTLGEALLLIAYYQHPPLVLNYGFNLLCLIVIWRYKLK